MKYWFQMKSLLIPLLFWLTTNSIVAQNRITGNVIDIITNEPIPYANVFLANTLIGTSTNNEGNFLLEGFSDGKYLLTVTHVGYQSYQVSLDFDHADVYSDQIRLVPISVTLNEIQVAEDTTDRSANLEIFKRLVIGISGNANECIILNPQKLHLFYDANSKSLYGHSKEPLIIENRVLGYRIFYVIDTFEYNSLNSTVSSFGIPRFELLESSNQVEQKKWIKNREEAYLGSVMHFIRSLYQNQIRQNGFGLMRLDLSNKRKNNYTDSLTVVKNIVNGKGITNWIKYDGRLMVTFNRKKITNGLSTKLKGNKKHESIITFLEGGISVFSNGEYENIKSLIFDGYWARSETMVNWLPYDYLPLETTSRYPPD